MKKRLDTALVEQGLVGSRERARSLVMERRVFVDGIPISKAGYRVETSSQLTVTGNDIPFVSRGGVKLAHALHVFKISLSEKTAMDVGASTGGFTDCLLQRGVEKVYAVDVGYGQLAWKLRNDTRVSVMERTNIRYLDRDSIPELVDIAVIDVSFISLKMVIPRVVEFLSPHGEIVSLIKPQFETGKGDVGKGGIVRDEGKRQRAVDEIENFLVLTGLHINGLCESPIQGQKGNREYFIYSQRGEYAE